MNHKELQYLTEQLKRGDNSALLKIYESCSDYCIKKLIYETSISSDDAEDIFIDAVMNFREKLLGGKIEYLISEKSYIYKTCFNMYLTRLEQQKRWNRKLDDIEFLYYTSGYQTESGFEEKMLDATRYAWEQLSERCKDIIAYFYIDKLSMNKIAELMELKSADVAKTNKSRCYKKLVNLANEKLRN